MAVVALGLVGMRGERVPLLGLVDLGFHELGHLTGHLLPVGELVTAAAGSFLQVAVPAGYFLVRQRDRTGGAACAAWAATSRTTSPATSPTRRYERPQLIGGDHDWAFFFSAEGIDAMHRAAGFAGTVSSLGWLLYVAAFTIALWPLTMLGSGGRPTPGRRADALPADGRRTVI